MLRPAARRDEDRLAVESDLDGLAGEVLDHPAPFTEQVQADLRRGFERDSKRAQQRRAKLIHLFPGQFEQAFRYLMISPTFGFTRRAAPSTRSRDTRTISSQR